MTDSRVFEESRLNFVMVPVPVEHADELRRYVLGLSLRSSLTVWEEGKVESYVAGLSDEHAAVLRVVNGFVGDGRTCARVDLATELGVNLEELDVRVQGMSELAWTVDLPGLVLIDERPGDGVVYTVPIPLLGRISQALEARAQDS